MANANINNFKQTLNITADIYNIIMKNRIMNKCNKYDNTTTYYRTIYKNKNKNFNDIIHKNIKKEQMFCINFCGGNINDCTCLHRTI